MKEKYFIVMSLVRFRGADTSEIIEESELADFESEDDARDELAQMLETLGFEAEDALEDDDETNESPN